MSVKLPRVIEQIVARPTWPGTVERPDKVRNIGVDYDTAWSRTTPARITREIIFDNVIGPMTRLVSSPTVYGTEHVTPLRAPVIFAANHSSHLDTAVVLSTLPDRFRKKTVVAAAADNFFDRPWKAVTFSLLLGTIPVERTRVNRKSADVAAELIEEGYNLVIFPEGGRTVDGWGREFRGGAAYLAKRCEVPVVPIHLRGVRPMYPKGSARLHRGEVEVRFGPALRPDPPSDERPRGEDPRRFALRIEQAVAELADEAETDWWSARKRAANGSTPVFRGPQTSQWRRSWNLPESARRRQSRSNRSGTKPW